MLTDESRHSKREREMLPECLSVIWNDRLVKVRSHGDMGVRKGIEDDIRSWILPVTVGVGLTTQGHS
jgi:hypothetical protein